MSAYITSYSTVKLPDGSKPSVLTADSRHELEVWADRLSVTNEKRCFKPDTAFCVISKTQLKLAVKLGALEGTEANNAINLKKELMKRFPSYDPSQS